MMQEGLVKMDGKTYREIREAIAEADSAIEQALALPHAETAEETLLVRDHLKNAHRELEEALKELQVN